MSWLSAPSRVLPSKLTEPQCRNQAPLVLCTAIGATTWSWSCCSGSHPSLVPHLRVSAGPPTGRRPSEGFLVVLVVGDLQGAAIQTDRTPMPIPSTLGSLHSDRGDHLVMELLQRFPPQSGARLRNPRLAGHLHFPLRSQ